MRNDAKKSEQEVFRAFVYKFATPQSLLAVYYRNGDFLLDQLVLALNILQTAQFMRERIPRSSQEITKRIASFLSSKTKTADAHMASAEENCDGATYSLGRTYGENARKTVKKSGRRLPKRLSPKWLAGLKN